MPGEQSTSSVWTSSSISVFLILTSICIVLSLSSGYNQQDGGVAEIGYKSIEVPNYVPNAAMFCVMLIGIVAMVVFFVKQRDLTTDDHETQMISRHTRHRKFSLISLWVFFIGAFIFHLTYVLVELSCTRKWADCEMEVYVLNIFEVIFHFGCLLFIICEMIVCRVMTDLNFEPSPWIWHGLAVIQAANVAQWFDAVLEEADHRIKNNTDVFGIYFTFCNTTSENQNFTVIDECSKSSFTAHWFGLSIPFFYPITIEFFLLVSENFLDRSIGAESRRLNQNAEEGGSNHYNEPNRHNQTHDEHNDERRPLLARNPIRGNTRSSANSICSNMFIMFTSIINIMYLMLSVIVYVNHELEIRYQSQMIDNVFTAHVSVYYLFSITCSVVGILSCRKLRRQHLRTSFLEYLLLFSTSGVLLQSVKRTIAFTINSEASGWIPVYDMAEILDIVEAPLQIIFYFYAKDVMPQSINDNQCRGAFYNTMIALSVSNFTEWVINSFLYANLNVSITPFRYYSIQQWPVFDNAVNPISIFFRFNSALLFCCTGMDYEPNQFVPIHDDQTDL